MVSSCAFFIPPISAHETSMQLQVWDAYAIIKNYRVNDINPDF